MTQGARDPVERRFDKGIDGIAKNLVVMSRRRGGKPGA